MQKNDENCCKQCAMKVPMSSVSGNFQRQVHVQGLRAGRSAPAQSRSHTPAWGGADWAGSYGPAGPSPASGPAQARPRLPLALTLAAPEQHRDAPSAHSVPFSSQNPTRLGRPITHASTLSLHASRTSARPQAIICSPLLPAPPNRT